MKVVSAHDDVASSVCTIPQSHHCRRRFANMRQAAYFEAHRRRIPRMKQEQGKEQHTDGCRDRRTKRWDENVEPTLSYIKRRRLLLPPAAAMFSKSYGPYLLPPCFVEAIYSHPVMFLFLFSTSSSSPPFCLGYASNSFSFLFLFWAIALLQRF